MAVAARARNVVLFDPPKRAEPVIPTDEAILLYSLQWAMQAVDAEELRDESVRAFLRSLIEAARG